VDLCVHDLGAHVVRAAEWRCFVPRQNAVAVAAAAVNAVYDQRPAVVAHLIAQRAPEPARAAQVRACRYVAFEDVPDGQCPRAREAAQQQDTCVWPDCEPDSNPQRRHRVMVLASADALRDQRPQPKPRTRGHAVADTTTRADRARRRTFHKQATTHASATATRVNNRRQPPPTHRIHTARWDATGKRTPRGAARQDAQTAADVPVRNAPSDAGDVMLRRRRSGARTALRCDNNATAPRRRNGATPAQRRHVGATAPRRRNGAATA